MKHEPHRQCRAAGISPPARRQALSPRQLSTDARLRLAWVHPLRLTAAGHPSSGSSQTGSAVDCLRSHPPHRGRVLLTQLRELLTEVLWIDP